MPYSCTKCFERKRTVGLIEKHVRRHHEFDDHVTDHYEHVETDDSADSRPMFLKDFE